jgi:hypothetical protein
MIKGLLILAIVIFAMNLGYQFTAPVIKNRMLEAKMNEVATNHGRKVEAEIQEEIMDFVHDKGIDLDENNLVVKVSDDGLAHMAARYQTTVSFINYSRTYMFFPATDDRARLYWQQFGKAQ